MAGSDLVGKVLDGRYRVESRLGAGGMATVYLAWQETLERKVVVKVPDPVLLTEEKFRIRFRREIRSLTDLRHPNVVTVLESGEYDGTPYAVMEYLSGGSLKDRLTEKVERGEAETPAEILEWLHPIAKALDYIHTEDVVHRDVKPGNILFDKSGNAFLSDFGIAKALTPESTELTLRTGSPGTPGYVPPEILDNVVLPAFDQYSLGATVFCALTNRAPRTLEAATGLDGPLGDLLPEPAVRVMERALSASPFSRFDTCVEFAAALEEALGERPAQPVLDPDTECPPIVAELVAVQETGTHVEPVPDLPEPRELTSRVLWLAVFAAVLIAGVLAAGAILGG